MARLRDLNLLMRRSADDAREMFAPRVVTDDMRARISDGVRASYATRDAARRTAFDAALSEWHALPPPVDGECFRSMLNARFDALKAWHRRVMDAAGCTRHEAERACYRARLRFEPRNTRGVNGRHKR